MNKQQQGRNPPPNEKWTHTGRMLGKKIEIIKQLEQVSLQDMDMETFLHGLLERDEKLNESTQKMEERITSFRRQKQRLNTDKRAHDIRKLTEEKQERRQKRNEELSALKDEQLRQQAETRCLNSMYVEAMVQKSMQFQEICEMFTYNNTQKLVHDELNVSIEKRMMDLEKFHTDLNRIKDGYCNTRVTLEANIHELNRRLEMVKENIEEWDRAWSDTQMDGETQNFQMFEMNMTIYNFCKIVWNMDNDVLKLAQITVKLEKILEFIDDMRLLWESEHKS